MTTLAAIALSALAALQASAPAAGLTFTPPASWRPRPAASTMRVAEFVIPKAPGDAEDGELVVYFFGGSGGSVDANIDRWVGQMQQPAAAPGTPRREALTVHGLKVTAVDVTGTYIAEVRPGATERHNKPGFRLRAAVIETPRGPYYIKMTGPAPTIAAADADFKAFVGSLAYR
jgi:hypothetical protein